MVADIGPLYAYVDIPLKNQPFPATIVIYNINNVYIVFLINLMLFKWTKKKRHWPILTKLGGMMRLAIEIQ